MREALERFVVRGVHTSIPFHRRVMEHPKFVAGRYDTGFIENELGRESPRGSEKPE